MRAQFVTKCIPSGVCGAVEPEEINSVIAGAAFENVKGIYTCKFTNDKNKVSMVGGGCTGDDCGHARLPRRCTGSPLALLHPVHVHVHRYHGGCSHFLLRHALLANVRPPA